MKNSLWSKRWSWFCTIWYVKSDRLQTTATCVATRKYMKLFTRLHHRTSSLLTTRLSKSVSMRIEFKNPFRFVSFEFEFREIIVFRVFWNVSELMTKWSFHFGFYSSQENLNFCCPPIKRSWLKCYIIKPFNCFLIDLLNENCF